MTGGRIGTDTGGRTGGGYTGNADGPNAVGGRWSRSIGSANDGAVGSELSDAVTCGSASSHLREIARHRSQSGTCSATVYRRFEHAGLEGSVRHLQTRATTLVKNHYPPTGASTHESDETRHTQCTAHACGRSVVLSFSSSSRPRVHLPIDVFGLV